MKGLVLSAKWEPREGYELSDFEKETGKAITGSSIWRHPKLEIEEVEDPKPGPDEVLIKVKACGICGSDIHFYETDEEDYILYPGLTKFPTIIGHEFSGEVVEVGKEVKDLKPGDAVTAVEMHWCGTCFNCRQGRPDQCINLEEMGFTTPGAMAEYIAVKGKYCWKITPLLERYGEEKGFEAGSLVEPTSVSYKALFDCGGGFWPGAYVVVFGAGPIGLAAIALAKSAGASRVIAFEPMERRRELAREIGADDIFDPYEVVPQEVVMELTKGEGADVQVEAAGAPTATIPPMESSLAVNGKIIQIGRAAQRVPVYLETLQTRRGAILGSQGHCGGIFPRVIRMMAAGLDMTKIITARFGLDHALEAMERASEREDAKVTIKP
jgi:hypothetical protein